MQTINYNFFRLISTAFMLKEIDISRFINHKKTLQFEAVFLWLINKIYSLVNSFSLHT
jgi:hypothetical protein